MRGFDELKYIRATVVILVFLATILLMFLPYYVFQSEAISYTQKIYADIFTISVENLASFLSAAYFQWRETYEAVSSGDDLVLEDIFREMRLRFPTVGSVRLIDRPPEIPTHDYFRLSSFDQEIYLYFNIYGYPMNNVISDKVAIVAIDKYAILSEMNLDERVEFSSTGSKNFAYDLRTKVKGYDLIKWHLFYSLIMGIICVLLVIEVLSIGLSSYYEIHGLQEIMYLWETGDPYTGFHSKNVAKIAGLLGRKLALKKKRINDLVNGAKLHDIGKVGISSKILRKHGPLDKIEMEVIRNHPDHGKEILEHFKYLKKFIPYAYMHHEREDGSGYPQGLKGDQIPLEAKIIAVADVFEALKAERPYRDAYSFVEAIDVMIEMPLDQELISVLIEILPELETELCGRNPEKRCERV
ncbi:MAG TPA: HD domain-containing protein [Mesotoga sp.]|nr:HD domain-containing protein [Mesotoga sp.]